MSILTLVFELSFAQKYINMPNLQLKMCYNPLNSVLNWLFRKNAIITKTAIKQVKQANKKL